MGLPPSSVLAVHWTEMVDDEVVEADTNVGDEGGTAQIQTKKMEYWCHNIIVNAASEIQDLFMYDWN